MQLERQLAWLSRAGFALGVPLLLFALAAAAVEFFVGSASVASGVVLGMGLIVLLVALPMGLQRRGSRWRAGVIATLAGLVELTTATVIVAALAGVMVWLLPRPVLDRALDARHWIDFVVYVGVGLGIVVAARGWRRASLEAAREAVARLDAERANTALAARERELARSELALLRAQVEPHFLWNTLAGVQYLTRNDPPAADAMVGHLIAYLRACVPQSRGAVATVGSEVESARAYLALMKIRMGPRFSFDINVEPACIDLQLPPLLLNTLVENAIQHGLEPKPGPVGLVIDIRLADEGRRLRAQVVDDGVGLRDQPATRGTGIGLSNVRARLRALFGDEASVSLAGRPSGGVSAALSLPVQTA